MTTTQLTAAAKKNSFENVNLIIENSGLELNLIQSFSFCKMWEVKNNSEIYLITNTIQEISKKSTKITFAFN